MRQDPCTSDDIRRSYVDFYLRRGHIAIPGGSLLGDSTVLFTSAGMQPLVPYFSGAPHPSGRRLVNVQRCLRTVDIDEVGDDTHLTCFEMLGSWSLGDYFKRESLGWTLEWLLSLGVERETLRVTVYPGDTESEQRWRELGIDRVIRARGQLVGPAGPARALRPGLGDLPRRAWSSATTSSSSTSRTPDGTLRPLPQRNVDVGMGLERITACCRASSRSTTPTSSPTSAAASAR